MKGKRYTLATIQPGDTFHLFRDKCHFVGTLKDGQETLYTYWRWNRYSRLRVYVTQPAWAFEIDLAYAV